MAKKKRHRVWWFALFPEEYAQLRKDRVLPVPVTMFDKPEMAYSMAYGERLEPLRDEEGNHVIVDGYAQLWDRGKITVVGVHGSAFNWKKKVPSERNHETGAEAILMDQAIPLNERTIFKIMEESDEMYANHLRSPMARAGGLTVPADVQARLDEKRAKAAKAAAELVQSMKREANTDGENEGQTPDVVATEVRDSQAES